MQHMKTTTVMRRATRNHAKYRLVKRDHGDRFLYYIERYGPCFGLVAWDRLWSGISSSEAEYAWSEWMKAEASNMA